MDSRIYTIGTPEPGQRTHIRTSSTEIQHLAIAWIAISYAFALVLADPRGPARPDPFGELVIYKFILSLLTVGVSFLLHELAHKVVAQRYNMWAEFRMSSSMLMFAVGLAYLVGALFAAPGAVRIYGNYATREQIGRIGAAGPLMNVLLALAFMPLIGMSGSFAGVGFGEIGILGVLINLWLAFFNMLPFSVLDGKKVFAWSKTAFAGIIILIILLGVTFIPTITM
ncbi:MAG: peptidase M50 [Candidatus Methanogaster sp.]|uniref:Peptidase M50 n=1 Tax=Candidatus Methanogaster sp. TaxID=3386292 RepID=A0AC61L1D8_9EURY|nr:MAG: peptidase M50 [ANME-2 cluster archaeon]